MNGSPAKRRTRVLPAQPFRSAMLIAMCVLALYVIEFVDTVLPQDLDRNGIHPKDVGGLDGVLWAPLLHGGWDHLVANTLPLLVLGWLVLAGGVRNFIAVTAVIWIVSGFGTWLVASGGVHIGASGVAFGWLVFLLLRGFFLRSIGQILVAAVLFFFWGGMLWGVLPGQPDISWEGHLFGALGGLLAAWLAGRGARQARSR